MINKNLKTPIYYQIEEWIKSQIDKNIFQLDKAIPSERELTENLQVSRHTVRQAVGNLVNQGYLYRVAGKGTFVKDRNLIKKENKYTSLYEDMAFLGKEVKNNVLSFKEEGASQSIANRLSINVGDPVIKIKRVRIVEDIPFSYEMIFIPKKIVGEIPKDAANESLIKYYEDVLKLNIDHALETIESVMAIEKTSQKLQVNENVPLLLVRSKLFLENGKQLHYIKNYYRGDKYKFAIKLIR